MNSGDNSPPSFYPQLKHRISQKRSVPLRVLRFLYSIGTYPSKPAIFNRQLFLSIPKRGQTLPPVNKLSAATRSILPNPTPKLLHPSTPKLTPTLTPMPFHLHLVSDSTGETVSSVARAAVAQFEGVEPVEHLWSLIRGKSQMDKVAAAITAQPGLVLYTLVDGTLRDQLRLHCDSLNLPCIPVLAQVIAELSDYLKLEISARPGKQHVLSDKYFSRVEAIDFTLAHDDGQSPADLNQADIILVGASRTSKSPTCVYLAHRGFKAANMPYVPGVPLPPQLLAATRPLIVGLTIQVDRLIDIRKTRLNSLQENQQTAYINLPQVSEELESAKRFYRQQGWPVIDVTRRSIEETMAVIIQYYQQRAGNTDL